MRQILSHFNYSDLGVCDLLEFGFLIGFEGNEQILPSTKEIWQYKNYKGAEEFPDQITSYLRKELD
jgi:hypothetical protein